MDTCHLFFIIFGVVLIALHTHFSFYYNNDCVWHCFVHHYTIPSALKWSTCSYGRSDPTKFLLHSWDLQRNFSVSSRQAATGRKIAVVNTAALYFKWIWWSQNLRTWKACAYCVVGLQDLNSSSEGNTVQSNIWDRTDSIITEVTVLGPHSIHTVSFYIHWIRSKRPQIRQRDNNQGLHFYSQGTAWQTCILEVPK